MRKSALKSRDSSFSRKAKMSTKRGWPNLKNKAYIEIKFESALSGPPTTSSRPSPVTDE